MNAVLPLAVAGLLALDHAGSALHQSTMAQMAPGDPTGAQTIPEKDLSRPEDAQGRSAGEKEGRSLSDKLDAAGGVIKPAPGIDPEIVKPAPVPHPNSMPVIPPPGMPGGPPGPEPK